MAYEIKSEVGNRVARVHANRLRKIDQGAVESGEPRDGAFPDSLPTLGKIRGVKWDKCKDTGQMVRWFRVQMGGRRSKRWTKENDLPDIVVKLYDARQAEDVPDVEGSAPTAEMEVFASDSDSD